MRKRHRHLAAPEFMSIPVDKQDFVGGVENNEFQACVAVHVGGDPVGDGRDYGAAAVYLQLMQNKGPPARWSRNAQMEGACAASDDCCASLEAAFRVAVSFVAAVGSGPECARLQFSVGGFGIHPDPLGQRTKGAQGGVIHAVAEDAYRSYGLRLRKRYRDLVVVGIGPLSPGLTGFWQHGVDQLVRKAVHWQGVRGHAEVSQFLRQAGAPVVPPLA